MSTGRIELNKTPLHALHIEYGARMVPFAGYELPVQYRGGILQEHRHTRSQAGLFDISHMGQIRITGDIALTALENLVPGRLANLPLFRQKYTVLTNPEGGIIDDVMVMHAGDHVRLVVNAACRHKVLAYLQNSLGHRCEIQMLASESLLALQGPAAAMNLARYIPAVSELTFMSAGKFIFNGIELTISRSGYTGEDGFELSLSDNCAEDFARLLLKGDEVTLAGFGARDSLRLEAGLCLYGQDIDSTTTPVEAGLHWLIAESSQWKCKNADYPGADIIREQLRSGTGRRRVGLIPQSRAPLRAGTGLLNDRQEQIGVITSGGYSPTLEKPIAMGYVSSDYIQPGTSLGAFSRGKEFRIAVVALPFVAHRYCH